VSKKQARSSISTVSTSSPEDETDHEAGIIRTIIVENFMNHAHLRINLDPHVNFIVGKNGSGKSAIVASCIAGLACKASSSGRNLSSYKSFIKHGEDYALIQVRRANAPSTRGAPTLVWLAPWQIHLANPFLSDPYKYDEFGDTLIVEHRIEKNGPGSYRLKSGCGASDRKSNKKEVEELCEHFNIQCENPCALLTQEAAKKFLHNGTEGTRYKFFLEAANLQLQRVDLLGTKARRRLLARTSASLAPRPTAMLPAACSSHGRVLSSRRRMSRIGRSRRRRRRRACPSSRRWRATRRRRSTVPNI